MNGQPPGGPWQDPWDPPSGGAYRQPANAGGIPGGYPSPPAVQRPTVLTVAVVLMYFGAAFWAFNALFNITRSDELKEMFAEEFPELTEEEIDRAVDRNASNAPVTLVGVGLWIWMAVMNGRGKKWARITGTVFGGINVALTLLGFAVLSSLGITMPAPEAFLSVTGVTLSIVIVILMFQRDASAYYDAMSRGPEPQYGSYHSRPY